MHYEIIDPSIVQEVIDGVRPKKSVEEISEDLNSWSNFMSTIINYIGLLINALKDFIKGD